MAQKSRGFEIEAGLNSSDLEENISYYIGGKYAYWFNPFLAYTVGISGLHSQLNITFDSPTNNKIVYYIDDNIVNLYCVTGFKASAPTFKNIGLAADLNFQFEPIPFNTISVTEKTFKSDNDLFPAEKSKNKFVYTHFNPSGKPNVC